MVDYLFETGMQIEKKKKKAPKKTTVLDHTGSSPHDMMYIRVDMDLNTYLFILLLITWYLLLDHFI